MSFSAFWAFLFSRSKKVLKETKAAKEICRFTDAGVVGFLSPALVFSCSAVLFESSGASSCISWVALVDFAVSKAVQAFHVVGAMAFGVGVHGVSHFAD